MYLSKKRFMYKSYKLVDFVWVSNHYDLHLSGLCREDGLLMRFETDYDTEEVSIYTLTLIEKTQWKIRQKLFELCVGYHWTYPHRSKGVRFHYRNPKWFWKFLFHIYYFGLFCNNRIKVDLWK